MNKTKLKKKLDRIPVNMGDKIEKNQDYKFYEKLKIN
jgi:hypothetical protein